MSTASRIKAARSRGVERQPLPDTSYVVMGLLSFGQTLTGYELQRWAHDSIRFFWSEPSMSQIYSEIARLSALGYLAGDDESAGARPRTAYSLTNAGRSELQRWLAESPVGTPMIKHPAAFRLFLGHLCTRERLVELLAEHRRTTELLIAEVATVEAALSSDPETWKYALAVATWGRSVFEGDQSGAVASLTLIDGVGP
jgi:DNA-binding PadR family transcriptional regulator